MLNSLVLTKNVQFFSAINGVAIDDSVINLILDAAVENMYPGEGCIENVVREDRVFNDGEAYKLSVRVFPSKRPVYFYDAGLFDKIYAYILVVETRDFIVISSKSCASISEVVGRYLEMVDYSSLFKTFDDDGVEFQKISTRIMTISDKAIRARQVEATDLKGVMSRHTVGRSIPYFLKIRQEGKIKTITASSSRLVESSERTELNDLCAWIKTQVELLRAPITNKSFLESFAKIIDLDALLLSTSPQAIMIECGALYDRLKEDNITLIYRVESDHYINVHDDAMDSIICLLEEVYEVNNAYKIVSQYGEVGIIKRNKATLTFNSTALRRLKVIENGVEVTLQNFIISNRYYSICFHNPKYMYFMGRCFEDSSGVSEINNLIRLFKYCPGLDGVASEKGRLTASQTSFDSNSVFGVIEQIHAGDDYIFCDDLGNEWADHITFNTRTKEVVFIHSKHDKPTRSASKFHDVVGQAIKNIGNMYSGDEQFIRKAGALSGFYRGKNVQTSIAKIRKGDLTRFEDDLRGILADSKMQRRCVIACSFVSYRATIDAFKRIQANQPVPGYFTQLFWILSSFSHSLKEANIEPLIYCAS